MISYNFKKALAAWREGGGAMNYYQPSPSAQYNLWEVTVSEELAERGIDAREATETALAAGGLSDAEIAVELADWQD